MKRHFTTPIVIVLIATLTAFNPVDDFASLLQSKLTSFFNRTPPVRLYVALDQPAYVPGDTMFYKITFLKAGDRLPVGGRQIIHLQLVDEHDVRRLAVSVVIKDGVGSGYLPVAADLASGHYVLHAYHNATLTANPVQSFRRVVTIAGKFETVRENKKVEFFPESGRAVPGVSNRVVVTGPAGYSASVFEGDRAIARVICDSTGWGEFYFLPRENSQYSFGGDAATREPLPFRPADGVSMLVTGVQSGTHIKVALQSSQPFRTDTQHYLLLTTEDRIMFSAPVDLRRRKGQVISFPRENLGTGVYAITLFADDGTVVSERLLYIQADDIHVSVSTDKPNYRVREPVVVNVNLPDGIALTTMALSAYQDDLFEGKTPHFTLKQYIDLAGGLPDIKVSDDIPSMGNIDRFMITQTRRDFSWADVWAGKPGEPHIFEPYQRLSGKAIFKTSGKPVPDSTYIQFFFQKDIAGYETYTGAGGRFTFPLLFDFYGNDEVHFLATSNEEVLNDVQILPDDVRFAPIPYRWKVTATPDPYFAFGEIRQRIDEAFFHAKPPLAENQVWLNERLEEEVNGADITVRLSDYLRFPTMDETLREVVPSVKSRENRNLVRVVLPEEGREGRKDPLYIIDGVISDNSSYFLALNPADVETIKVINTNQKLSMIGGMASDGVILVDTRIPDHAARIPIRSEVFSVTGLMVPGTRSPARMKSRGAREPDLRSSIYWNPDVTGNGNKATVTFNCPDNTGRFRVAVEGVTRDGKPFTSECFFTVSFHQQ